MTVLIELTQCDAGYSGIKNYIKGNYVILIDFKKI